VPCNTECLRTQERPCLPTKESGQQYNKVQITYEEYHCRRNRGKEGAVLVSSMGNINQGLSRWESWAWDKKGEGAWMIVGDVPHLFGRDQDSVWGPHGGDPRLRPQSLVSSQLVAKHKTSPDTHQFTGHQGMLTTQPGKDPEEQVQRSQ
jgi:hypothetical protein